MRAGLAQPGRAWLALCGTLVLGSLWIGWGAGADELESGRWMWRAEAWPQAPWTLWSAALVHALDAHQIANALALGALALLGAALAARAGDALALLIAWPLSTAALLAWPQVQGFYGLSGVVHAAAAVLALRALHEPGMRAIGVALALGLAAKLGLEHGWRTPIAYDGHWGFNVVYAAHLSGAAAGALAALGGQGWAVLARSRS